nr:hypothetical protein HK105_005941 [Polyrhizophydium stewartii]
MGGTSGDADGHAEAPNSALDEDAPQPHEVAWDAPPAGFRFEDGATSEDDDDDDGEVWEENTAKDVTARYSVAWSTTTRKLRLPPGERGEGWWKLVLWLYSKSVKTARERREDAALAMSQVNEPMPTKFAGFENHPLYTLERHCKKDQIIFPKDQKYVVGVFKKENVYPRSHVHTGRIPRNPFGNIEILHPRMIPSGAVHIPVKGVASVARKLGVDFAQALTGFQFAGGRPTPVIDGIVVLKENEEMILEAFDQDMQAKHQAQLRKREAAVLARWRRLVVGLMTRARLFREYMRD